MVLCPDIEEEEAVWIMGTEQYSDYEGYGKNFNFVKNYKDSNKDNVICAIDAINYSQFKSYEMIQFSGVQVLRELNKAFIGFKGPSDKKFSSEYSNKNIATGR
eukprot:TRINITY_DN19541_c0_g1_i2.p2 TRINITY_DN19541_c0_g1~~TRINITY_DN19541_c0_g1_i2.p2  ORF type:complete len:103 (-),score=17.67 TRINITY_DN19541_c0_g1_i2:94-402(-)